MMRKTIFFLAVCLVALLNVTSAANHPVQVGAMVYGPPLRMSAHANVGYTAFERDVRLNAHIGHVFDTWTSPKEGRVHVEHDTRRWHRGAWRRSS
jgi:hypothetical protein